MFYLKHKQFHVLHLLSYLQDPVRLGEEYIYITGTQSINVHVILYSLKSTKQ